MRGLVSCILVLAVVGWVKAQETKPVMTLHVGTSLTLVDVIAENSPHGLRTRILLTDLRQEDFRIRDNWKDMPIQSFDTGAEHTTRPIALWIIVQCPQYFPLGDASMFIQGKVNVIAPALSLLAPNDAVGVAHWCDNGDAKVDLPPGHDGNAAIPATEAVLDQKPPESIDSRTGELAMQHMIEMLLDETHHQTPARLPVYLFLYGDRCGAPVDEVNRVLEDLLENDGIVFGLNDGAVTYSPYETIHMNGEEAFLVHYYSAETGGQVYSTSDPKLFSNALEYLLTQLHLRYTIGFKPKKLDGKRHRLVVELTPEARKRYGAVTLRYRPEYVPVEHPQE